MAGRNKQPLSVIQGKGRSNHITKSEKNRREKQEEALRGHTDKIEAPSYLTAAQKKEFDTLAAELVRLGIFSNLDVDSLARYIDSKDQYIKLVRLLRKTKPSEDFKNYAQMQRSKNLLFNECRSSASDLGLTITSRLKLVIPEAEKTQQKSEAQRRFGDRI
ncbi:phage terminase small subunit P27 family [Bacillus cytotoxicus]|uniref:Phage terminase, small subunit, P27 family n=1 Tax=Bacillus cytotoxicus TaxID=580165 RepID=A0AAX2CJN2_9BACI|nr:phage terminase small subunit P27 family [Bacillus cytotoxicus]AWC29488.1 phage terminase small subunit P27 family [Bacillus cytotoxicus]AWC41619.1 phage terminase small subunit P27 family [Bacillus cytotoxicus]AWC45463.1 phage terminase small subunit P27 family [Bacillus cytotoxicus]AWC49550.1 phage terminase small subunit P27 family [Bacillus cytotoxicus]AWC53563.1 phage terminase small subunit P27 family [Bacillus cytotoxicus]